MGRRKKLTKKFEAGEFVFTKHAYKQMVARDIYIKQVQEALLNGVVVKKWENHEGNRLAIVGKRFNGDYLKIVVKDVETPTIITVCYPHEESTF